ncbi:hypothetical protein GGTG_13260 [Gaeumannomyces tritici R3-111a-1]|uniref:Uncharacterized protein n=1 Tax=Gaeumannomyces tritici (strain R3-111a-1) TaxID=644352 RepID=J3PID2_GAET3|nr:hypothetical protein GGTG_13260 [Gaeumannomyces tritici R3-111a-1]EJT69151.1 hypothetical protein GGTG_13260 [Gaeumannomyces tritici R3-111a-1]
MEPFLKGGNEFRHMARIQGTTRACGRRSFGKSHALLPRIVSSYRHPPFQLSYCQKPKNNKPDPPALTPLLSRIDKREPQPQPQPQPQNPTLDRNADLDDICRRPGNVCGAKRDVAPAAAAQPRAILTPEEKAECSQPGFRCVTRREREQRRVKASQVEPSSGALTSPASSGRHPGQQCAYGVKCSASPVSNRPEPGPGAGVLLREVVPGGVRVRGSGDGQRVEDSDAVAVRPPDTLPPLRCSANPLAPGRPYHKHTQSYYAGSEAFSVQAGGEGELAEVFTMLSGNARGGRGGNEP